VSQHTLYGYVKTRIGTRFVMMFNDEQFAKSVDIAKWNIYVVSLQDLSFFCLSYLHAHNLYKDTDLAKSIYLEILSEEKKNGLEEEVYQKAISQFEERFSQINWTSHYQSDCFLTSSQALYYWAPIADELKKLDKAIVINSMHLKWENIKKDFPKMLLLNKII
ncbi:esterase, partial [Pelagibacteraceae bacterium]|nr:esterase [Pelagibacteraceae bacterium]